MMENENVSPFKHRYFFGYCIMLNFVGDKKTNIFNLQLQLGDPGALVLREPLQGLAPG